MAPSSLHLRQRLARAGASLPPPVLRALAGAPTIVDGQELDLQLQAGLRLQHWLRPRLESMTPAEARHAIVAAFEPYQPRRVPMAHVFEECAPGPAGPLPIRVYVPERHDHGLLVWFHGGGGVLGSIAAAEPFCRDLAERTRCAIASVEYRLAPEHPHPAAIDDALAAWTWAVAHAHRWNADPALSAVGGDSFGAYLAVWVERRTYAAVAGHAARPHAPPLPRPRAQLLIYPILDFTTSSRSCSLFAEGYGLTLPLVHWYRGHYLGGTPADDASPRFLPSVAGAPPTLLVGAGFDPLRDEGKAYAERLREAGASVTYRLHTSLIHGFIDMTGACTAAREAVDDLSAWLHAALAGRP